MKISVIISTYNEADVIEDCIRSLKKQTRTYELIIVDDGSDDNTLNILKKIKSSFNIQNPFIYQQKHQGPGAARNFGANRARGDILIFVDADMTFDPKFIEILVNPIEKNQTQGTFAKKEYVANWDNIWARCWNYNQGISNNLRIPQNYPDQAPVFRAILAQEFKKIGGFSENIGWTDDWSLSKKLGYQSTATNAICYHKNPQALTEIFKQSKWIGKNEFISGNPIKALFHLIKSLLPVSILIGTVKAIKYQETRFLLFKIIYDFGILSGIFQKTLTGSRNK